MGTVLFVLAFESFVMGLELNVMLFNFFVKVYE